VYAPLQGKLRNVYKILIVKPEGKRPLARHSRRLEENIKMNVREVGLGGVN
jgi:hypothetical protein